MNLACPSRTQRVVFVTWLVALAVPPGCEGEGAPPQVSSPSPQPSSSSLKSPSGASQVVEPDASSSPPAQPSGVVAEGEEADSLSAPSSPAQEPLCERWVERVIEEPAAADALFPNGIASAAVRPTRATIWARTRKPARVRVVASAGRDCPRLVTPWVSTLDKASHVAHVPLEGLPSGAWVRYQVEVEGGPGLSSPGWLRTPAASVGEDRPLRMAFAADVAGFASEVINVQHLINAKPEVYFSLGDWPYVDLVGARPRREVEFRRHYEQSRSGRRMEVLMRMMPVHAIWDDHEMINDWDARYGEWNREAVVAGKAVWKQWWPVADAPEGEIYRKHTWGPNIDVFWLDTRGHRMANGSNAEDKTMLGLEQRRWFLDGLASSEAAFKLVITSVPLDHAITFRDSWDGFAREREILMRFIDERGIGGVVFLAGDQHFYASHHFNNGAREWQGGPLAMRPFKPFPTDDFQVLVQGTGRNFGVIDYSPDQGQGPSLTFQVWSESQGFVYEEVLRGGRGRIEVSPPTENWRWRLDGPHRFQGQGPARLNAAPPGEYTVIWKAPPGVEEAPPPSKVVLEVNGERRVTLRR